MNELGNGKLELLIKDVAKDLNIAPHPMDIVKAKVESYYDTPLAILKKLLYSDYMQMCVVRALKEIRDDPIENQMYLELERYADSVDESENKRISKIIEMLSVKKLFLKDEEYVFTLRQVLRWLMPEQCERVKKCILALKDYCDEVGVCSILEGANVNASKKKILLQDPIESDLSENAKKYQPTAFVRRLELMTRYIRDTANIKVSKDETFATKYWLRSTGFDPHCEGRHALFLVNKGTDEIEYVYKPHDLSADNAVVGEDGMLGQINKFFKENDLLKGTPIKEQDAFVTVHIDPENHLEDFVLKKSKMIQKEAENYFYKAGMLQVITDAMAVTDLHQDNIMPTEDGPLIIDAEVDYFRANFSGLLSALTWLDSNVDPRNASFLIDKGEGETVRSWKAFQNKKSTCRAMYIAGQEFMRDEMQKNKDYLLREFDEQLSRVNKSRILPMSTPEFSDYLQNSMTLNETFSCEYNSTIKLEDINYKNGNKGELASGIINKIKEKFTDKTECYIFTEKYGVYLQEDKFVKCIMETFENGTIIAMYMNMDGYIYLDDKCVGYLCEKRSESDKSTKPPKVPKSQVIQMIKDHFIYVIENYEISNGG